MFFRINKYDDITSLNECFPFASIFFHKCYHENFNGDHKQGGHCRIRYPLSRRLRCGHYRATCNVIEDFYNILENWESRTKQRNDNLVSS